jgi:hypothetical protein
LLLWASAAVWYCSTLSFLPYATRWSPRICLVAVIQVENFIPPFSIICAHALEIPRMETLGTRYNDQLGLDNNGHSSCMFCYCCERANLATTPNVKAEDIIMLTTGRIRSWHYGSVKVRRPPARLEGPKAGARRRFPFYRPGRVAVECRPSPCPQ